ncbi:MAG: hypothetical protein RLZZ501_1878 [Pseudomonadota bacterium]|jgi:AcrR family transcriptional regulator
MSRAHARPKQPDLLRRQLLDCALRLVTEQGLTALTVQAVAEAAGATKGGLFHHFPSKRALIEAVFAELLALFEAGIEAEMARDPEPRGRFTRAYVVATFADHGLGLGNPVFAKTLSLFDDPGLVQSWSDWLAERTRRHADTDGGDWFETLRLAADGAWIARVCRVEGVAVDPAALCRHLLALTRVADPAGV